MGRHLSEETRAKISAALKGKTKVISIEQRQKISETMTGRILSDEHIRHLRESRVQQASKMRGRKLSEEHCKKVSEALKGHKVSEETRAKISATLKGKTKVNKVLLNQNEEERQQLILSNKSNGKTWNKGVSPTADIKEKMRIGREAAKIKKQKYIEEYQRLYGNESSAPIKQDIKVNHTIDAQHIEDEYYKTHLRPEEWELPMIVIARRRNILIEELNNIFLNHINAKKII